MCTVQSASRVACTAKLKCRKYDMSHTTSNNNNNSNIYNSKSTNRQHNMDFQQTISFKFKLITLKCKGISSKKQIKRHAIKNEY
jgi:hypothetical protein